MRKNFSEAIMTPNNKLSKELSKENLLETSQLNNTSFNQSQISQIQSQRYVLQIP